MAFPIIQSTATTGALAPTNTLTNNIAMPSGIEQGDLLLVVLTGYIWEESTLSVNGWSTNGNESSAETTFYVATKIADGDSSDSISLTYDARRRVAAIVYRITGHNPTDYIKTEYTGNSNNPPPPINPGWGEKDILWFISMHGDTTNWDFDPPVEYANKINIAGTLSDISNLLHYRTISADRELTASSEAANDWNLLSGSPSFKSKFSIAIQPAGASDPDPDPDPPESTLNNGVVAYYPMEESSAPLTDAINNYNGTDNGTNVEREATGINNLGYYFNGLQSQSNITIPDLAQDHFEGKDTVSISFWIRTDAINWQANWVGPFSMGNGKFRFEMPNPSRMTLFNTPLDPVPDHTSDAWKDQWNHSLLILDGSNGYKWWINGVLEYTGSVTGPIDTTLATIGSRRHEGHGPLTGWMDEIGVWNRALTDDEALELWNDGDGLFLDNGQFIGSAPPPETGGIKYFDGSIWEEKPMKYYDGTEWVQKPVKRYNGSDWV